MARTKKNIPIRLLSVEQKAFRMDSSVLSPDSHDALFGFNYSFSPNAEKDTLAVFFEVVMYTPDDMQELLMMDAVHTFKIDNLPGFISHDSAGQARLSGIIKPILDVIVGTTRGLLIAKTSGTPLSQFVLPLIDITRIVHA